MSEARIFFLAILGFIVLSGSSSAALLGVNKVSISYEDVLRNGYAEDTVVISSGSDEEVSVFFEARGDIGDWIRFEPEDKPLIIPPEGFRAVRIIVEPPADIRSDNYSGKIVISTGPLGNISGNIGASVEVGFEIQIRVSVTDAQILSCTAGGFEILDAEIEKSIPFIATFNNKGNVRIRPDFLIKVLDQEQNENVAELKYSFPKEILPTTSQRIEAFLENNLEPGQYWAYVSSPLCPDSTTLVTFSILEKGGISDIGELIRIENKAWAETGENVPVDAYFKNKGSRVVSAQFKGVVTREDKVVEILKSDKLDVAPGEVVVLGMFFKPSDVAQYRITGRVHYNNKITFEKGSMLNVNQGSDSDQESSGSVWLSIVLTVVVIIIGIFIFLLLKRRKRKFKY